MIECGKREMMYKNPIDVCKNFYVCDDHFQDNDFASRNRTKLRPTAVPSLCSKPIENTVLVTEFKKSMKKWKGKISFVQKIFLIKISSFY